MKIIFATADCKYPTKALVFLVTHANRADANGELLLSNMPPCFR
jgi:hypothetical protein